MRFLTYASDLLEICKRTDISGREILRLLFAYTLLKVRAKRSPVSFLQYRIAFSSRTNFLAIVRGVFFLGDYAFKSGTNSPNIFDVGANIGIATLFFKRYHPKARIKAFEAMPENVTLLEKNILQNKLQGVTHVHAFVGKERGARTAYYNAERPGGSTGVEAIATSQHAQDFVAIEVPAIRLSDYVDETVHLLKLDVEGAEGEILRDLDERGKLPLIEQIVMEYHANEQNDTNRLSDVMRILENAGFSTVIYDDRNGYFGKKLRPSPAYHFMIRAYQKRSP